MYAPLELSSVASGSSVLLVGDGERTAREYAHATLAGPERDAVLVVTTAGGYDAAEALAGRGVNRDRIGVVDASRSDTIESGVAAVASIDGPGALSDIGVAASEQLEQFGARHDRTSVGLHSVTALLDVHVVPAVFRFLHVLDGRVRAADAVFVATIDRTAHDAETVGTVAELFDRVVDVPTEDAGPTA